MKIEGQGGGGDRVMAKIGPAPVRDVLLSLLEGSRYRFRHAPARCQIRKRLIALVLSPAWLAMLQSRPRQHGLLRMKRRRPTKASGED